MCSQIVMPMRSTAFGHKPGWIWQIFRIRIPAPRWAGVAASIYGIFSRRGNLIAARMLRADFWSAKVHKPVVIQIAGRNFPCTALNDLSTQFFYRCPRTHPGPNLIPLALRLPDFGSIDGHDIIFYPSQNQPRPRAAVGEFRRRRATAALWAASAIYLRVRVSRKCNEIAARSWDWRRKLARIGRRS